MGAPAAPAMPVIHFRYPDFATLYGDKVERDALVERLPQLGGDLDKVEGDDIHIEYFPDRPDLVSVEGIARAMRAFDGIEPGARVYHIDAPEGELVVDPSVAGVRPFILACQVRGLPALSDDDVADLMDFQEKLAYGIGRRRQKVAIGIHDARDVAAPYRYTTVDGAFSFEPLQSDRAMTVDELLTEHDKGVRYARLLPKGGPYPIILDKDGHVLSLPPVINGKRTALAAGTTDLVLDLTGPDPEALAPTMAILVAAFADRGARIVPLKIRYPDDPGFGELAGKTITPPDMAPTMHTVGRVATERVLGLGLDRKDMVRCLNRMGHDASLCGKHDDEVHAYTPAWRADILHEVDLIEDIAKGYGYGDVEESLSMTMTYGSAHPTAKRASALREVMVGLGYLEATTLTISSLADQYGRWGLDAPEDNGPGGAVAVANPITEEHTHLRHWLVPGLFQVLAANRHRDYPQSLFEVGQAVQAEAPHANTWHLAAVHAAPKAGFTAVKGVTQAVLGSLAVEAQLQEDDHPGFIPGRAARWVVDGRVVGRFGEVHPQVLEGYDLGVPVMAFEFDLEALQPLDRPLAVGMRK